MSRKQQQINSILNTNQYLTRLKLENPQSYKARTVHNFLTKKVGDLLGRPKPQEYKLDLFDFLFSL